MGKYLLPFVRNDARVWILCMLMSGVSMASMADAGFCKASVSNGDFSGGTTFNAYRGKDGHAVFAGETMQASMVVNWNNPEPAYLHIMGRRESGTPISITLNGTVLLDGENPFNDWSQWEEKIFAIPSGALQQGANVLTIEHKGTTDWFMVSHAIIESRGGERFYTLPGDRISDGDGHLVSYFYNGEPMNIVYADPALDMRAELRVDWANPDPAYLRIRGMCEGSGFPIRIALNGSTVFEGTNPYGLTWSDVDFPIPAGLIQSGWNSLIIENNGSGSVGFPPWVMASSITIASYLDTPDIEGMLVGDAISALQNAGLTVGSITYDWSETLPEGLVITQSPPAGSDLPLGSVVDLVISQGLIMPGGGPIKGVPIPVSGALGLCLCALVTAVAGACSLRPRKQ